VAQKENEEEYNIKMMGAQTEHKKWAREEVRKGGRGTDGGGGRWKKDLKYGGSEDKSKVSLCLFLNLYKLRQKIL
jgi:hypothetical protein